jgi:hypothetical protein
MAETNELLTRPCGACGQLDTDPRHVIALADQSEVAFHIDCHAATTSGYWGDGPCPSCTESLKGFEGKGGPALRKHILGGN